MTAIFLHHTSCETCGSKDNNAVYDDGHQYCFGCRKYIPGRVPIHHVHSPELWIDNKVGDFPFDATPEIPSKPLLWLLQYGITQHIANSFGIYWSPYREALCWQVKSPRYAILGWSTRNFSEQAKVKTNHYGAIHDDINIVGIQRPINFCDDGDTKIVLVEDYLSAIKVSQIMPAMCLYGCTISLEALQALSKTFKGVIVWLDSDKLENSRKIALKANLTGLIGQVLYTELDPKCYSRTETQRYLKALL